MRRLLILTLIPLCTLLAACSNDDDTRFPSMWNEIVCLLTDDGGQVKYMVTDDGQTYQVTNTLNTQKPNTAFRVMCGYSITDTYVTLYQTTGVHLLQDSTACAVHDPLKVLSAWKSGSFINLHLAPLTQGGQHMWGYAVDSTHASGHHYLSLHHRQGADPLSYTQETYASLSLSEIPQMAEGDSITLSIHTFNGIKTWNFRK